jgi:hypothetical protein
VTRRATDPYRPLYLCQKLSYGAPNRIVDHFSTSPIQTFWMGSRASPAQEIPDSGSDDKLLLQSLVRFGAPPAGWCEAGGHRGHSILCLVITSP